MMDAELRQRTGTYPDAISAGQFISRNKSDRLIDKIRMLAGPSLRESLRPCILTDSQVRCRNM